VLSALLVVLTAAAAARAQEVRWRYDYSAARAEAQQQGLPLFIDLSTEWCYHCKRLDQTTFRDPAVAKLLNEQFVPVKLDGTREKALVDALRVQAYPTLILAGPEGKILQKLEGYQTAPVLHAQLQAAAVALVNPEWMARAYQDAVRAATQGDIPAALAQLRKVLEDNRQRPVQEQARRLWQDIELQARARFGEIRGLEEKGLAAEAVEALGEFVAAFAGTQAASDAAQYRTALAEKPAVKAQLRRRRAADLLAGLRADLANQLFLSALDRCVLLSTGYADLPEGQEAARLLEQLRTDPDRLKALAAGLTDRLAEVQLALAETWLRQGDRQLAAEQFERVLATAPGSRHADSAKARLAQLRAAGNKVGLQK
jgi:tetratricopeptide (TPR) repeat protein